MIQATSVLARLIESIKPQGQLKLPLVGDLQRAEQSYPPTSFSLNSDYMTKVESSTAAPVYLGESTLTAHTTSKTSSATHSPCSINRPQKKAYLANPSSKEIVLQSQDTVNQILCRPRKLSTQNKIPLHLSQLENISWDSDGGKKRLTIQLWNPQNSTPRDIPNKQRAKSPKESINVKGYPSAKSTKQITDPDGSLPLLSKSELQIISRHSLPLENDSGPNDHKDLFPAHLNIVKRRSRKETAGSQKEPANVLNGDKSASIVFDTTEPAALSLRFHLTPCNTMPDLENGLRPRFFEERNSFPVSQYAKRDSTSTHTGIGALPSPISSDDSSILGSELGEHSPEEWGPQHPCYPHLNPHVPITSPLFHSTRVIRIQRDWMLEGDLAPTFSNLYPEILDPAGVSEQEFRQLLESVNREIILAFDPLSPRNIIDGLMSLLTGWLWEDFGLAAIKKNLIRIEKLLEDWNRGMRDKMKDTGDESAIPKVVSLRRTGYLTVCLFDPLSNQKDG